MLNKNKTLNDEISYILSTLKYDDVQLSNLLRISLEDLNFSKNIKNNDFDTRLSEKEESLYNLITSVYCYLHRFKLHFMTADDCVITLTHVFEFEDSNKQKFNSTLIELAKGEFISRWGTATKVVDSVCKINFERYTVGKDGQPSILLNKKISEVFLNRKVEVKEVWRYSESGDYTELKVQELIEVFTDGSGEDWQNLKDYSTDMGEAWKLVELLAKKGVQVRLSNKAMHNDYWWCYISSTPEDTHPDATAQGSTAPEAICLAILDYVEKKKTLNNLLTK